MAIEFSCRNCSAKFRVAETMAGKKIRCPKCQAIEKVPGGQPGPPPEAEYGIKGTEEDFWDQVSAAGPGNTVNPFDAPAAPPARPKRQGLSERQARGRLIVPATVLYILSMVGLGLSILFLTLGTLAWILAPNAMPTEERVSKFLVVLLVLGTTYATSQGFANMRNMREPSAVWFALLLSMTPCGTHLFCPVAIPFALWGIVVMCDQRVNSYFRR